MGVIKLIDWNGHDGGKVLGTEAFDQMLLAWQRVLRVVIHYREEEVE